ncbi:PREDICTED: uncharacterized protein LOC100634029 [Amphimedon queenslandica]|uniref:Biogenesis of lysosome-related organelles complex 1 subunit 7 n=1 Tax=Amphimedon queenslandica TaxID=400682 RepID=A0A1X7U972_AMPQE|nr:PREDICTED: uncharacterized protein LOC100634029 [Amphimedon queenslandica]XP_019855597.1 PREDICTED: uncharacterized protein LOC100634029 [Amphimedon queenslandica]|eukprot:XP_003388692.1 PREDICTED: uncharacterized protein LOC100634029 [Amphimedon queenslandica]
MDSSDELNFFSPETIENLTEGFLNILQPEVITVNKSLSDLTAHQEIMLASINSKRTQFEDTAQTQDIQALLIQIPNYKQKILNIQKTITSIDRRMKKLQVRANKLKELRVLRETNSKKELEKRIREEQILEAKPSK